MGPLVTLQNACLKNLREGRPAGCIWLSLGAAVLAEIALESGAETVVFDLQHGLWERVPLEAAIGLLRGRATPLVRVAENTPFAIGMALDAGAEGVIVPMINSAEEAERAVAAAHYPPYGIRSGGGIRPLRDFAAYQKAAARETLVAVMIETVAAVQNLDEILAVAGIDLVFIGGGDLAMSIAAADDYGVSVADTVEKIRRDAEAAGIPSGLFTMNAEEANARLAQGFRFVVAQNDLTVVRTGFAAAQAALSAK